LAELPTGSPAVRSLKLQGLDPSKEEVRRQNSAVFERAGTYLLTPVISYNGAPIQSAWSITEYQKPTEDAKGAKTTEARVLLRGLVSTEAMKDIGGMLSVTYPFKGPQLATIHPLNDPNKIYEVHRLHDEGRNSLLMLIAKVAEVNWNLPATTWKVVLNNGTELDLSECATSTVTNAGTAPGALTGNGRPTSFPTTSARTATPGGTDRFCRQSGDIALLQTANLPNGDTLILRQITENAGGPVSYTLTIPKKKDEKTPEKPLPSVNQYDSRWVALDVEGLKPFETAEIDGRTLDKNK
jgi:hypothetical protein